MTIIKSHLCKSCGGLLDVDIDRQLYICPFCGLTYDYEYFREENVLDIATRALNRCEFGSAKEAFDFVLQKDPHSTQALRGILLCNAKWKNMVPLNNAETVFIKKDEPALVSALENCEPESKGYFEDIKKAISVLSDYRENKTEIKRMEQLRDVDQTRLSSLYMSKAQNEEKFTSAAHEFFAEMSDERTAGFIGAVVVMVLVLLAGIVINHMWWILAIVAGIIMLVVAVYNINKAITSNSLDAAIAPVKEKVAKMDEELSKKRQFGQDLMKEYKEIVQKVLDADIKFYKAADDDKTAEKEDAAGDDDLNLEL